MAKVSYAVIKERLSTLTPFEGNTMSGDWVGDTFTVFSYRTVIATATRDGERWATPERYSVTTSKHQGYVRRAWNL